MRIPHTLKEVICSPPAHISTVMDYVTLTETVNGLEQKILTQFVLDAARFEPSKLAPNLIVSLENIVATDTTSP